MAGSDARGSGLRHELKGSDAPVDVLFEHLPLPTYLVDFETLQILQVNEAATAAFEYTREEFLRLTLDRLWPPAAADRCRERLRAAEHGIVRLGAISHLKKDGSSVEVGILCRTIEVGGRNAALVIAEHVAERDRAEQLVEASPTGMALCDPAGRLLVVNAQIEKIFGYSRSELVGAPVDMLVSERDRSDDYRPELPFGIDPSHQSIDSHLERVGRHRDGRDIPLEIRLATLTGTEGNLTLASVVEATERRPVEDALRASERRLRNLFETVNLIVLVLDSEGRVEYVNPFFLELTGYTHAETIGCDYFERFIPMGQQPRMIGVFLELVEHEFHPHYQNPIVTRSGEERLISWHNTVVRDAEGRPTGTLSVGEDVTAHARLEAQFRQAQKMEAVGRLAGGVAHDFSNLLTAIIGYTELIDRDLPATTSIRQDVGEIKRAAERAAMLTRQLLAFSRQQRLQPAVINLNDVVRGIEKMLRRLLREDVELSVALSPDLGNVRADVGQIEQVIMNLTVNARDAMPSGGTLAIETRNAELHEWQQTMQRIVPGPYIVLAVSDTGVGMTPAVKARLFEPFFTTKEKGKGTGLGLATVYGIVNQSGGYIWADSQPGQGTTFTICLPRVLAPVDELIPASEVPGSLAGTETILLAEDDELLRPLVGSVLQKLGYTVLAAPNADEALARAAQHRGRIHLLVTDLIMPGASGRDLADRLAAVRPDTRVLFVSGHTGDAIAALGLSDPGVHHLQKPFAASVLARKVREILAAP